MFKKELKIGVALLGLLSFGNAQAIPISGELGFDAYGEFTHNTMTGDMNGFDFSTYVDAFNPAIPGPSAIVGPSDFWVSGSILDLAVANLPTVPVLTVYDFNADTGPFIEWILTPIVSAAGAEGNLVFTILDAQEIDGGGGDDLGGNGLFSFACTSNCGVNTGIDALEDTIAQWSLSVTNPGQADFVAGYNVPAPATIGLLGLGLLGLGAIRNRRVAK